MNLILMPVAVSIGAAILFVLVAAIGGILQVSRHTAAVGRRIVIYGGASLLGGLIFSWFGFLLMLPLLGIAIIRTATTILPLGVVGFWASVATGMVIGLRHAQRRHGGRKNASGSG